MSVHELPPLDHLADALGHHFGAPELLALAVTHRSWCAEHGAVESNERLEFLGDAVLGWVVTDQLFHRHPDRPEGDLHQMRAAVVNATTLAGVAAELGIGSAMRLGKGEERSGGRTKPSILADAMEAVIGAVYLDAGSAASRDVVLRLLADQLSSAADDAGRDDAKSRLNEMAARHYESVPSYSLEEHGPDHDKEFRATVVVGDHIRGRGTGRSKKLAEQAAAADAWRSVVIELGGDTEESAVAPGGRHEDA